MKMVTFNEDSRVKIPAIIHLSRLGYEYILKNGLIENVLIDKDTNIFINIFKKFCDKKNLDYEKELKKINELLSYDDLGEAFYKYLIENLIDFNNFEENYFNVVSELTFKKDEDEFRPDITVLINGIPLIFIEVKKPNNFDGMNAEKKRLISRFKNKNFKKFFNEILFMIYSNNMEYVDQKDTLIGSFYTTPSLEPKFNYFREEDKSIYQKFNEIDEETENFILKDNNLVVIKHSPEYKENKSHLTPLNKFLSSLLNKERLKFILKYAIAFVNKKEKQKHIMRYPQIFATFAIKNHLDKGNKKGIIWHTQGSGKTALSFYNVKFLNDYFAEKNKLAKFYFIVDRLDLLKQARDEFLARGLVVKTIQNKEEFVKELSLNTPIRNDSGKLEITVVNIQKFDTLNIKPHYDLNIQRVYFIDEAHRSYNPKGTFLWNLYSIDKDAVFIAFTGTPLLKKEYKSTDIFGDYIHKYYYNLSIKDGYTLRLIREEIEANYKVKLKEILEEIEIQKGSVKSKDITSHKNFVKPMLEYIIKDLENFRRLHNEKVGGMVVCDTSEQARALFKAFNEKIMFEKEKFFSIEKSKYKEKFKVKSAALILHDEDTKAIRENKIDDFKEGKIDLLIVYNMLLTGFDAPILKKLYLTRVIKAHNLLQTLTRVNRPYKDFKYGYIVDFANIKDEFDKTNRLYWQELQNELGDEVEKYSEIFKSSEEIEKELKEIEEFLFSFDTENLEVFSEEIREIEDIEKIREIIKKLEHLKELFNIAKLYGYEKITKKMDIFKINKMLSETKNYLALLRAKEAINKDFGEILNIALEDVIFEFAKVKEEELKLADELKEVLKNVREEFIRNFDKDDVKYISLKEELEELLKKKNIFEATTEEIKENIPLLKEIYKKIKALNSANERLSRKYKNDKKFAKIHKKLRDKLNKKETEIREKLLKLKEKADEMVLNRSDIITQEEIFKGVLLKDIVNEFKDYNLKYDDFMYIGNLIVNEYISEYRAS
jgi:type I restriction enzyme R subunit